MKTASIAMASAALATLLLGGCGSSASSSSSQPTSGVSSSSATPSLSASPSPSAVVTNADGYMIRTLGEGGSVSPADGGKPYVLFHVLKITSDIACTSGYADKPANGHYVGIYMDVTVTAGISTATPPYFNTDQWSIVGPDGIEENSTSGHASSCLAASQALPTQIEHATHRRGWVVIDVKATHGKLRLTQDAMTGGWEYTF